MKLRFWKKEPQLLKTVLSLTRQNLTSGEIFYVETTSPEKALELIRALQKKEAS